MFKFNDHPILAIIEFNDNHPISTIIEFNNNQAESINYWTKEYVKGDKGINIILGFVRVVLFLIGGYLFIKRGQFIFLKRPFLMKNNFLKFYET